MTHGDFRDRHVVVTGGTGELGGAVVELLLEAGATCHVPSRSGRSGGKPAAERLNVVAGVDLTDEGSVRAFYGGLPSLWASIHCAGGFAAAPVADVSQADFSRMFGMNAVSAFLCSREAVRRMRGDDASGGRGTGGRIVNVASMAAVEPRRGAGMVAYTASKAAVVALTEALAEEVAAEGIWVNAVAPSILDTPANRRDLPEADHSRWPKVHEVATTILHLASPHNHSVRGSVVKVYGRS